MIKISGKIIRGWGRASKSIPEQKKYFSRTIPGIQRCFNGTLNVLTNESPFPLFKSYVTFMHIHWKHDRWESFMLFPVTIILGKQQKKGWLYRPFGSAHFREKNYVEILAPKFNIGKHRRLSILIEELN